MPGLSVFKSFTLPKSKNKEVLFHLEVQKAENCITPNFIMNKQTHTKLECTADSQFSLNPL